MIPRRFVISSLMPTRQAIAWSNLIRRRTAISQFASGSRDKGGTRQGGTRQGGGRDRGDATEDKTAARAVSTLPVGRHRRNVETALAAVFPLPVPSPCRFPV